MSCNTTESEVQLLIDVPDTFVVEVGERIHFALASTLKRDGSEMPEEFDPNTFAEDTLANDYECVMHGRVFRCLDEDNTGKSSVLISCGGLLLLLKAEARDLHSIELDKNVFVLIRTVQ